MVVVGTKASAEWVGDEEIGNPGSSVVNDLL